MNIKFGDNEYTIAFAMQPTIKSGLVKKLIKLEGETDEAEVVEKVLELVPEMILIGLQKNHREVFGFNYDNKEEMSEKLDMVYEMLEDYLANNDVDFMSLYADIEKEMLSEGFLASLFRQEMKKTEQKKSSRK